MLVPAAIKVPRRGGKPSLRLNQVTKSKPVAIAASTTGNPAMPSLSDIEHAQADADEHDAGAKNRRGRELEPGIERCRQRQRVAQQQPEDDRHGHAGERAAAGQSLRGENLLADQSASQKPASMTTNAARTPGNCFTAESPYGSRFPASRATSDGRHRPTSQKPPMTSAAADEA